MKRFFAGLICSIFVLTTLPLLAFAQTGSESDAELISATEVGSEYFAQTIDYFKYEEENYADPQVEGYTDEDFFGKFENGEWVKQSVLNYDQFPELSSVEEAAKDGSYTAAKEALLSYYRERYSQFNLGKGSSSNQSIVKKARLNLENASSSRNIADIIKVTTTEEEFDVNVTDIVKSALTDTQEGRVTFLLTALRKDGNMAVFHSKESGDAPTLTVTANGRSIDCPIIADTYAQAGLNANERYGNESVLIAEESYSTIGVLQPSRVDKYTKRAAMLFDLSAVPEGATIGNARLKIKGNILQSDNPTSPDTLPDYKDIVVMDLADIQWTDEESAWNEISGIEGAYKSYWGEYSYETPELTSLNSIGDNALKVYFATGEEAYAYAGLRFIMQSLTNQMVSGDIWLQRTLSVSSFVADFPASFADILKLPNLTAEKFGLLIKFIYLTAELASETWTSSENTNNWGTANASGVAIASICYPEFKAASEPLEDRSTNTTFYGGWLEVGRNRLRYMADKCLFKDGSCVEVSFAYTKYNLNLFQRFFAMCNNLELNAKEILGEDAISVIEKYATYMLSMSNPLGGSWQQGDENQEYTTNVMSIYKVMIDAFGNPQLKWLYSGKREEAPPEYLSKAYDVGRKAVLRSGWEKSALALQINADAGLQSHGQADDLGLNLFAYDRMLLADPMQPNYNSDEPVTAWLYSRGHNIIEINGVAQRGGPRMDMTIINAEGEEEELITSSGSAKAGSLHPEDREFNPFYNYIKAQTLNYVDNGRMDENFTSTREVLMLSPQYVIVTDYLSPDGSDSDADLNKYSQYWHSVPGANMTVDGESGIAQTHFDAGANLTIVPVDGEITSSATKHKGWYHTANEFADYVRYVKKTDEEVTFNTVLYPTAASEDVEVSTQRLSTDISEGEASAFGVTINNKKTNALTTASYYNLHDKTKKGQRTFGDYITDGKLAYVQKLSDSFESAILRGGSLLKTQSGEELIKSLSEIPDLGVKYNGTNLYLYSSKTFSNESFSEAEGADVNLAADKDAAGSVHYESTVPENALDGDYNTAWSSPWEIVGGEYPWLSIDLGEEKDVSRIKVTDDNKDLSYSFYYSDADGNWINVEEINSYTDPLSGSDKPCKIYEFSPFKARNIKICADDGVSLLIYEAEVYSALAQSISLSDLSIYAPNVSSVYINDEGVTFYRNGDYIVFDENAAGSDTENEGNENTDNDTTQGNGGSINTDHGNGGSVGSSGGGGGGGTDKDNADDKENENTPQNPDAAPYDKELANHWGEDEIRTMLDKGIVKGDGISLNLKNAVTRSEFAALLIRALEIPEKEYGGEFSDVDGSEWYADTLAAAYSAGLMEGSDGKALPNDTLTREQMAKMLVSAKEYLGEQIVTDAQVSFDDNAQISAWALPYVAKAVESSLMNGMGDNTFAPKGTALREQAFVAVYRLIG